MRTNQPAILRKEKEKEETISGWLKGVNLLCREGNSQPGHWMLHH